MEKIIQIFELKTNFNSDLIVSERVSERAFEISSEISPIPQECIGYKNVIASNSINTGRLNNICNVKFLIKISAIANYRPPLYQLSYRRG